MTDAQKKCDDIDLGILLTDRSTAWYTVTRHNETGAEVIATLVPALIDQDGYWFVGVVDLKADAVDTFSRPASPFGVGLFLPAMGVDLPCDWRRCDQHHPTPTNPFLGGRLLRRGDL